MAVPLLLFGHCKLVHASRCPWLHLSSLRPHARLRSVSTYQRHCCQSPQTSAACQAGVLCLLHACRAPPPGFLHLPSIAEVVLLQTVGVGLKLRLAQRPPKLLHGCRAQGPANPAGSAARSPLWQRIQQRVIGQHQHANLLLCTGEQHHLPSAAWRSVLLHAWSCRAPAPAWLTCGTCCIPSTWPARAAASCQLLCAGRPASHPAPRG